MPIYTKTEIEEQVFKHEGVKIRINAPEDTLFKMSYSEFFPEPISDEATVNELKIRLNTFVNTQCNK